MIKHRIVKKTKKKTKIVLKRIFIQHNYKKNPIYM